MVTLLPAIVIKWSENKVSSWTGPYASKLGLLRVVLTLELWRGLLQGRDQVMRGRGSIHIRFHDDLCGACGFAIELAIRVFIGTERRALQRYTGKNTSCAGVAQNFRAHICISVGGSRAAFRSSGDRCVRSQFNLGKQEAACAAVVHDEKNEVGGFSANLQTDATAFQRVHGWRTPGTGEVLAGAADHRATAVAAANNKRGFQHRRHHDDATGLVEQVLRNVVRDIEDFLDDSSCVLKTILFRFCFARIFRGRQWPQSKCARK